MTPPPTQKHSKAKGGLVPPSPEIAGYGLEGMSYQALVFNLQKLRN